MHGVRSALLILLLMTCISGITIPHPDTAQLPADWYLLLVQEDIQTSLLFRPLLNRAQYSENSWLYKEKIAISLGCNCTSAGQLDNENIHYATFPFDWCITPVESIIKCINNDFNDFFLIENLKYAGEGNKVLESLYNLAIVHDFPFQHIGGFTFASTQEFKELIMNHYDMVQAKFLRRIERFKQLSRYQGKMYFIRSLDITKHQAIELLEALNNRFRDQDFLLVVINQTEEFKDSWDIPKLKNFFVDDIVNKMFTPGLFTEVFKNVGLI